MSTAIPAGFQSLNAAISVAGQLTVDDMAWAAQAGFKTVINNRPDGEGGPEQARSAQIQAAAEALGLIYHYFPVNGAYQSEEEIAAYASLLPTVETPVLAFCRSGARSTRLYMAAMAHLEASSS